MNFKSLFFLLSLFILNACSDGDEMQTENPIDNCVSKDCGPGECIDGTCDCPKGFEGDQCEIESTQKKRLLKSYSINSKIKAEYQYSSAGNLIKQFDYVPSGRQTKNYIYLGDTVFVIEHLQNEEVLRWKFFKSDLFAMTIEKHNADFELQEFWKLSLPDDCGYALSKYFSADGDLYLTSTFSNDGDNCGGHLISEYLNGSIKSPIQYERDNKKNPIPDIRKYFHDYEQGNTTK